MKNIFKIFKRDLKSIFTNSMAIILAVGVAVLPSLYAWFNIYANWDPYGNTGNMMVAVINDDEGAYVKEIPIDVGDQIVSNLKGNKSIDWQFVSKSEAVSGVEGGKYYAAIEIPKGFSKSLTSIMSSNFKQPTITYYANEKKNAIATKITDKVVQTVQTEVNESFVVTIVNLMNQMFGTIVEESEKSGGNIFTNLQNQIDTAKQSVTAVQKSIDSFADVMSIAQSINTTVNDENIKNLLKNSDGLVKNTEDVVKVSQTAMESVTGSVTNVLNDSVSTLKEAANTIKKVGTEADNATKATLNLALKACNNAKGNVDDVAAMLKKVNDTLPNKIAAIDEVVAQLNVISKQIEDTSKDIQAILNGNFKGKVEDLSNKLVKTANTLSSASSSYKKNVQPKLTSTVTTLLDTLGDVSNIINSINGDLPKTNALVSALNESIKTGDNMVKSLNTLLTNCIKQLDSLSKKIDNLSNGDLMNTVMNLTDKNADELGEFIACPVKVETDKVYGIENYGSAMAPFYSTLAIWVGSVILIAIIKTDIKHKKDFPNLRPHQEFFGRSLLFILMGVVQGLIICLGDLYFLRIQCYHPIKFIFAGVVASIVYSLFIYSLAYCFGDIGKALVVIMLVIQIGGSGGTFPIDVTPSIFRTLNPYLPFTFVIEAMRECICGTYENLYWIWLLKLCAYLVVALIIGLLVKMIVKKPIKFFNKRIEQTGLF